MSPPGRVARVVRLSIRSGVATNTSPADTAALPLKSFITAATSGRGGKGERSGALVGRKVPTVRFACLR